MSEMRRALRRGRDRGAAAHAVLRVLICVGLAATVAYDASDAQVTLNDCEPPPYPVQPDDSASAARLPSLAEEMRALADTVNTHYRRALGPGQPGSEGLYWWFHVGAARAAEEAVSLNPLDARSRLLYGELLWNLSFRADGDRDSTEALEGQRQIRCALTLAKREGESHLIERADSLLRFISRGWDR